MAELEIDPRPAQVQIMYLIYNQFFPSSLYDKMKGETSDIYISLMCIHGIYIYIYTWHYPCLYMASPKMHSAEGSKHIDKVQI